MISTKSFESSPTNRRHERRMPRIFLSTLLLAIPFINLKSATAQVELPPNVVLDQNDGLAIDQVGVGLTSEGDCLTAVTMSDDSPALVIMTNPITQESQTFSVDNQVAKGQFQNLTIVIDVSGRSTPAALEATNGVNSQVTGQAPLVLVDAAVVREGQNPAEKQVGCLVTISGETTLKTGTPATTIQYAEIIGPAGNQDGLTQVQVGAQTVRYLQTMNDETFAAEVVVDNRHQQ